MSFSLSSPKTYRSLMIAGACWIASPQRSHAQVDEISPAPAASPRENGTSYTNKKNGYSVTLPARWNTIPQSVIRTLTEMMSTEKLEYDAAFEPSTTSHWFACPYVLVQSIPYSKNGLDHTPSETEIRAFSQMMSGLDAKDFDELAKGGTKAEFRDLFGRFEKGRVAWEPLKHRITWTVAMQNLKGVSAVYFGKKAAVQVMFYTTEDRWDLDSPVGNKILDSFAFDSQNSYPKTVANSIGLSD
jgi:hypothetical protein